jgi:hypothetical protein
VDSQEVVSILTKDVLVHRGWKGKEARCMFYECDETKIMFSLTALLPRNGWGAIKCAFLFVKLSQEFSGHQWFDVEISC